MENIDTLMLSIIILLFPLLVNVLYNLYINNGNIEANNLFLDITLLSSAYLLITLNHKYYYFLVFLNIVFLLSLLKDRIYTSIIILLLIIINYNIGSVIDVIVVFSEYIIYYLIYILFKKKNERLFTNLFMFIKIFYLFLYSTLHNEIFMQGIINGIITSVIYVLINFSIIYIIKVSEDIVKLHMNIKELEKEKQIRTSLFKITHEIKNPVAVCKSYLDMFDYNNKEHAKYIPIIKEEIDKILLLLQDFLSMNKIKIKPEIIDINLLLDEISRQYKSILENKNIKFICDIRDDEDYIDGDYNRLSQVLTNILKNSLEAVDESKQSYIKLSTIKDKNIINIIVEDNGIGMENIDLERVKEPFYTTKKNGTGLGVSLSNEIIIAHNGSINYESEFGVGTKVVIKIPLSNLEF